MIGYGITFATTYLGRHLAYDEQMGICHMLTSEGCPMDFIIVRNENELTGNTMEYVRSREVLFYRQKDDNI